MPISGKNERKMRKQIEISEALRKEIIAMFALSPQWVSKALRYDSDADSAERIRSVAIDRGGKTTIIADEWEVILDAGDVFRQSFPNGATLEIDKLTGDARILRAGKVCAIHPAIEVSRIRSLQQLAREL